MSRQSKQAKRAVLAAEFTQLHKQGQRGPKRTTPKRSNQYRISIERRKSVDAFLAALANRLRDARKALGMPDARWR